MPLRRFECSECGTEFTTKNPAPLHCNEAAMEVFVAPQTKFMEKLDPERSSKSKLIDQEKILKERARKHSRDNDLDDLIQNNESEVVQQNGWVGRDGRRRKAIDDL